MASKKSPPRAKPKPPLSPSQRRDELRVLLRAGWQPLTAILERLGVSRATAFRRLKELGETDPLETQEDGEGRTLWRLPSGAREHALHITTAEMVALAFVKNALGFLSGTGLKEDLEQLVDRFAHVLTSKDYAHWKNIGTKLYDVNEGCLDYSDKMDVVNDVITALLAQQRITLALKDGRRLKVEPYTMVLYKKGLYVLGHSFHHESIRLFGLDIVEDVERHATETFAYPKGFDPAPRMTGPFGLIRGAKETVVVRFRAKVERYVKRRKWHASQRFEDFDGCFHMTSDPEGYDEMVSWVLSFGETAEVLAPPALRAKVAQAVRATAALYADVP